MFDSIFKKQFFIYMSALFISFALLGTILSQALKLYFTSKRQEELTKQAPIIAEILEKAYYNEIKNNDDNFDVWKNVNESKLLSENENILVRNIDSSYFYARINENDEFTISSGSIDVTKRHQNTKFSLESEEVTKLKKGDNIKREGNLNKIFKEDVLTIGYPVQLENTGDKGTEIVGALFMNTSVPELKKNTSEVYRIFLICLVLSAWISFVLIYVSSKSISKPLYEMNEAAKIISKGDFEKRITVNTKDEVGQLAESFNSMAESLLRQEEQRRNFISNISHDLRSPLTSVGGYVQAILDGTLPPETHEKYLNVILEETKRLSKLANDLMDITNLQIISLNRSDFDINELIRKTLIQLERRVSEKNITMEIYFAKENVFVNADYEKVQRIIYNIVDNAVKFTGENGKIVVTTALKDDKLIIAIEDDGRGISENDQKFVFDRFYKADSSRGKDKNGSGLGLSIIKELIKAHDETITLESKLNKGTKISFTLELKK